MTAWIGVAAAVVVAAFFSLAKLSIASMGRLRLRRWVRQRMETGERMDLQSLERPFRLLSPILVGQTLTVVAAATLAARAISGDEPAGAGAALRTAGLVGAVLVPPLYLLGETVPRAVARARAHQVFPVVAAVLRGCAWIFRPLTGAADAITRAVQRLVGSGADRPAAEIRRSLETLLAEGERVGVVEPAEREIIVGVIEFGSTPVRAIMTPVDRIAGTSVDATAAEVTALIRRTGYSRIPVWSGSPERIVGMVHVFDLFKLAPDEPLRPRRVVRTGPDARCDDLLLEMKRRRHHLAVVVENGRAVGMVTMEDLVEELVGEIRDEHDARMEALGAGSEAFVVDGSTPIAEISESQGIDLSTEAAETVAGFVISRLGRVPRPGEALTYRDWSIEVLDATPQRVRRVRFRRRSRSRPTGPA